MISLSSFLTALRNPYNCVEKVFFSVSLSLSYLQTSKYIYLTRHIHYKYFRKEILRACLETKFKFDFLNSNFVFFLKSLCFFLKKFFVFSEKSTKFTILTLKTQLKLTYQTNLKCRTCVFNLDTLFG